MASICKPTTPWAALSLCIDCRTCCCIPTNAGYFTMEPPHIRVGGAWFRITGEPRDPPQARSSIFGNASALAKHSSFGDCASWAWKHLLANTRADAGTGGRQRLCVVRYVAAADAATAAPNEYCRCGGGQRGLLPGVFGPPQPQPLRGA
jgi:hypothetical protein